MQNHQQSHSQLNDHHPSKPLLIIGNKNYSSWSLRAWLALHAFGIDFNEQQIELFSESAKAILQLYSPTGKVPVLVDTDTVVWDSLAIVEYVNYHYLNNQGWGINPALARSLACEMHSGFIAIRQEMPMNIRAIRRVQPSNACLQDIARIDDIFNQLRNIHTNLGNYLFGEFSLLDAFFAPIAFRLQTYAAHANIHLQENSKTYCQSLLCHPSIKHWQQHALLETSIIKHDEIGETI